MKSAKQACIVYEKRAEKTYLSRLEKWRRLSRQRFIWRILFLCLNLFALALVILPFLLEESCSFSSFLPGIIALVTFVNILLANFLIEVNLDRRIWDLEYTYRELQIISQRFELMKNRPNLDFTVVDEVIARYQEIIKRTENHEKKDYNRYVKNSGMVGGF